MYLYVKEKETIRGRGEKRFGEVVESKHRGYENSRGILGGTGWK